MAAWVYHLRYFRVEDRFPEAEIDAFLENKAHPESINFHSCATIGFGVARGDFRFLEVADFVDVNWRVPLVAHLLCATKLFDAFLVATRTTFSGCTLGCTRVCATGCTSGCASPCATSGTFISTAPSPEIGAGKLPSFAVGVSRSFMASRPFRESSPIVFPSD